MESWHVNRGTQSGNIGKDEVGDKIVDIQMIRWYFLERLYQTYEDEVYKTCLHYAKDEHIARDMTQKTFFSIYEHYENVKPGRMKPYLLRTAKNMTMNWLRDFKRLREGQIDDLNEEDLKVYSVEDVYIREESAKLARELSNDILTRLQKKNERWYELVVMAYYFDIPQEEIARRLGIKVELVYSRLYRAKQWIRKNYKEEYERYVKAIEG